MRHAGGETLERRVPERREVEYGSQILHCLTWAFPRQKGMNRQQGRPADTFFSSLGPLSDAWTWEPLWQRAWP